MSRAALNLLLLVLFLASLAVNWAVRPRPSQPNREFLPEMVRTPRYNAYAANPNFPDGKTLQTPVAGTIPRGSPPFHFAATPEDAVRAGEQLRSPVLEKTSAMGGMGAMPCCGQPKPQGAEVQPMSGMQGMPGMSGMAGMGNMAAMQGMQGMISRMGSMTGGMAGMQSGMGAMGNMPCCGQAEAEARQAKAVARGAVVFANFCQPCHGPTGKGDGLVVAKGYPAPPSLSADNAKKIKDGQIFHILTYGQKNMPSYAAQLSSDDRWNAIAYIRSLQAQPEPQAAPAMAPVPTSAAAATTDPIQTIAPPSAAAPAAGGRP